MRLEDLVGIRLKTTPAVAGRLASFSGEPAVFYQTAPYDRDPGWRDAQYPRIDFTLDRQANPERQGAGTLALHIWCLDRDISPEELEPAVKDTLCGVFLQPEGEPPFSLSWLRSEAFEARTPDNPDALVNGITLSFDLLAFPCQQTFDPDPVMAMNHFAGEQPEGLRIIGVDTLPDFYTPSDENPAVYFRLTGYQSDRETNTVAWMNCTLAGHLFAPSAQCRLHWLKVLADRLALRGEVIMMDGSPLFLKGITIETGANPHTVGQLRLRGQFGILRRRPYAHPTTNIIIR